MDNSHAAAINNGAYSQSNVHGDTYAHRDHNPYANKDPYENKDAHKEEERRDRQGPWALDFEIIRFFRENYNAGVDFEESPRAFFDEEYLLAIRLKLLSRNIKTMFIKFLFMVIFSSITLLLHTKGLMIFGSIYILVFLYFVAVPMGFVKYCRQYVMDDTDKGKLKKIHNTYLSWIRPLEIIAMNIFTLFFILLEIVIFFNVEALKNYIIEITAKLKIAPLNEYVSALSIQDLQFSILVTSAYFILAYVLYWVFIYKIWAPKWEKVRLINEKAFKISHQRAALNLMDKLTKEDKE